jgi:arginine deiminase
MRRPENRDDAVKVKNDVQGAEFAGTPIGSPADGVYSEVGTLRVTLVCAPGLAHGRLSPRACRELKFAAPLWVERAQHEFSRFVAALREQGVEVLELHTLLVQTLEKPAARQWLLDRMLEHLQVSDVVGVELRAACDNLEPQRLAELLIGGATLADLGLPQNSVMNLTLALPPFVLPPLPHSLCLRESHSWIQSGVTLNQASWRGPRGESLLVAAIYRYHPRFGAAQPRIWWGDVTTPARRACAEGGDIMPLGHGVVLIGVGGRTQPQAAIEIARGLFEGGAAHTVIAAQLPCSTNVPLDHFFTQCSPDVVTYRPDVVDRIACQELRPTSQPGGIGVHKRAGVHMLDVLSQALHTPTLNAIASGADFNDSHDALAGPWDDGNGVLALAPGVVLAFERNVRTNRRLREAGIDVIEVPGSELARVGTAHGLCCPIVRDALN